MERSEAIAKYGRSYVQVNAPNSPDYITTGDDSTPTFVETLGQVYEGDINTGIGERNNRIPHRITREDFLRTTNTLTATGVEWRKKNLGQEISLPDIMLETGATFAHISTNSKTGEPFVQYGEIAHVLFKPIYAEQGTDHTHDLLPIYFPIYDGHPPHRDAFMTIGRGKHGDTVAKSLSGDFCTFIVSNGKTAKRILERLKGEFALKAQQELNNDLKTFDQRAAQASKMFSQTRGGTPTVK